MDVLEEREDSRGSINSLWAERQRDNHYLDCELMIDATAIVSGGLKAGQEEGSHTSVTST
ncbi:MAG TPA: hypothetical protein PKJ98_04725 [Verrucomicrobiota bacterium]|nr:hypothetical protein [Verrucomicrobiota bacterium]